LYAKIKNLKTSLSRIEKTVQTNNLGGSTAKAPQISGARNTQLQEIHRLFSVGAGALPNKAKVLKGRLYLFYRMLEQVYLIFFQDCCIAK
jgi:hypothetical protein